MTKQMEVEDHEVETTEVKKKHKKKEKKVAEMQDEETVESDASIEKKRKKKEKKEKKEKKRKSKEQSKEEEKEEEKKEEKPKKKEKRSREEPTEEAENGHKKHKQENGATHKNSTDVSKKPSFRKNFYQEHKSLANFTKEEVEKFRQERNMTVTGIDLKPVRTFEESTFSKEMLEVCKGFKTPTPIQSQCWPIILSGRDVIGIAETGSGKTIAFTLPALVHIKDQPNISKHSKGPIALILSPTRELAMQIGDVCTKAGQPIGVKSLCVYGGVPKPPQAQEAERGVHIIVATPGRLVDLMQDGSVSLDRVTYLVLDEADAMLDLGFEREIKFILSSIRTERQTLMFSATWPKEIQQLAAQYFSDPVKVTIGSEDLAANHRVQQIVEVIEDRERDRRLVQLLNNYHQTRKNRIMVFVLYKKEAVRVEQMLQKRGFNVIALHGDKSQNDRTRSRDLFVSGTHPLLVATDVAARGLDFPNVEYVINYSFPLTIEDYVHRIGRTGRAGKTGVAHTFFMQSDKGKATELIDILKEANQPVPDDLDKMCTVRATKKKEHKLYGNAFKEISLTANKPTRITFDD